MMGLLHLLRRLFGPGPVRPAELSAPVGVGLDRPVVLETSDTLDLHAFSPRDVASVVAEFLEAALEEGFPQVRIIHGKGIGVQREIVRGILAKHPEVVSFGDALDASGWGATIARLRSRGTPPDERA